MELERVQAKEGETILRPTFAQALKGTPAAKHDITKDLSDWDNHSSPNQTTEQQANQQQPGLLVYSTKKVTQPSHYARETIPTNFTFQMPTS